MTRDQTKIFIEERKWDYRSKQADGLKQMKLNCICSLWVHGHVIGKDTNHRTRVFYFKPCWRGYVGSRYVNRGQIYPHLNKSPRSGEDSAFCSPRTGKKAVSSSMIVLGCPRQGLRSDSVTWNPINVLISLLVNIPG